MSKLKFYKYASLVLLLLNLSMVAFFIITKPRAPRDGSAFKSQAMEILQLDEQQQNAFLQSAKAHHQQIEAINAKQSSMLKPYFQHLAEPETISNPDTLLDQFQLLERQKIETTYQHFQEVHSILRPAQQAGFEVFMNDALQIILLNPDKSPHPPKGF